MAGIRVWPWVALGLAALVLVQQLRVQGLQLDLANIAANQAQAAQKQAEQTQQAVEKEATALLDRAEGTQANVYEYTQTIQRLESARAADAGRIASLQHDLRAKATAHAQAAGDLAACRGLADQHQQLAALAAEGAGLVREGVSLVKQRDAEVTLLKAQVLTERDLLEKVFGP